MNSEEQPVFIGRCLCNCPVYKLGEVVTYTCHEYPCSLQEERREVNNNENLVDCMDSYWNPCLGLLEQTLSHTQYWPLLDSRRGSTCAEDVDEVRKETAMTDKICLSCKRFVVITGEPDYSDVTLGSDVDIYCRKGHWRIDTFKDTEDDYEQKMMSAKDCEDYVRR